VGRRVDLGDLVDAHEVATILGLAYRNTVANYQQRYTDMPRPVLNMGRRGRCRLWLPPESEAWPLRQAAWSRPRRDCCLTTFPGRTTPAVTASGSRATPFAPSGALSDMTGRVRRRACSSSERRYRASLHVGSVGAEFSPRSGL